MLKIPLYPMVFFNFVEIFSSGLKDFRWHFYGEFGEVVVSANR